MRFNEKELIEFFSVLPVNKDAEEKEFFGSSLFEVTEGKFILRISFSFTHPPNVIVDLLHSDVSDPVLHVDIHDALAIRIDNKIRRLMVLARSKDTEGSDPDPEERLIIYLDPLKVVVYD